MTSHVNWSIDLLSSLSPFEGEPSDQIGRTLATCLWTKKKNTEADITSGYNK